MVFNVGLPLSITSHEIATSSKAQHQKEKRGELTKRANNGECNLTEKQQKSNQVKNSTRQNDVGSTSEHGVPDNTARDRA